MERLNPNIKEGLTKEQVERRFNDNLYNYNDTPKTKTVKEIILSNFLTYFNFLNLALGLAIIIAGLFSGALLTSLKNCLFMGVIIVNSIISIIEELISKRIIDKLSVLNETGAKVIRDGKQKEIDVEEIVLDDIICYSMGHQIVADSIIMEGEVEVNEALLTGESDSISKKKGDLLLSGSFIVAGSCTAKVEHVGKDNYVSQISKEAKYQKKTNSVIMDSFEKLLKILSIAIIPVAIVMFITQLNAMEGDKVAATFATVAAVIGMIPEGLVLLTSSVMAVSVIRLSKYKVLVQQLYCIETLSRVDVICLDKTGTLTEGSMKVKEFISINEKEIDNNYRILGNMVHLMENSNPTMDALREYFTKNEERTKVEEIPFSSERKYSCIKFSDSAYYIGAPEVLVKNKKELDKIKEYQKEHRVLVFAQNVGTFTKKIDKVKVLGYILVDDVLRTNVKETLDYFKSQNVAVKIISGDSKETVLGIAAKVGLTNMEGIDLVDKDEAEVKDLVDKYDVFGRVTPKQKKWLVESLQKNGHTVAMTGDGVNDVLALKQSDCAISFSKASDAARNVSQLVLLNNDFASLPEVVAEGRRTINNVERSGSLLLAKTLYTIFLVACSIITASKYYFIPIQLTFITAFTVGAPSFILALEPNHDLVKGHFLMKIFSRSLPVSLTILSNVILVTCFGLIFGLEDNVMSTVIVLLTVITGLIYLHKICYPYTIIRGSLFFTMLFGFIFVTLFYHDFFNILQINEKIAWIVFVLGIDSIFIYNLLKWILSRLFHLIDNTIPVEN